jgi:tol-pal system protein YbgF
VIRLRAVVASFAVAVPLAACSSVPPLRGQEQLATEVRELRARVVEMQRQAAVDQLAIEELRQQVATLEAALGVRRGSGTAARPTASPAAPRPAVADRRAAEPPPEPIEPPLAEMRQEDLEIDDVDAPAVAPRRPGAPPDGPPAARPPSTPPVEPATPAGGAGATAAPGAGGVPEPIPPAGQALYDRGYTLYHQGRHLDAESSFQRFLQAHADTDLADNAQYWIGESRFARGDYRGALAAFRETVSRYPQGNKVPDALLKAGQCLEQIGDPEGARDSYRQVVDRFPTSAAAVAAEERLARLP